MKTPLLCLSTALVVLPVQAENVLRWASQGDALTFDPHAQNEGPTNTANLQVYEPLIRRDANLTKVPGLAVSWTTVEPTVWEFKLREGVTFHDGAEFNAEDVVFSFQRAQAETSDFRDYITSVSEIRMVDDFTVQLVTDGPNPILPDQITTIGIMDKGWSEEHEVTTPQDFANQEETYAVRNANGTGPFILELREPDVRTVMVKNPDWWGLEEDPHNVDRVVYTPVSNQATRVAALLSGELDYVLDPPLQDLERIKASPGLQVQSVNQIRTIFLGINTGAEDSPFASPEVRQAMYQAIDIDAIQQKVMRGNSIPAGIITSPGVHGYTEALDERLPYDPEAAQAMLAEAGYGDGFEATLDCPNDRYNNDEAICQAVVGMLGRIGITVNLDAQTKSLHFPKIQNRETDFYMLGWGVPPLDSHYVFNFLYRSDGSWNATGFADARLDELVQGMEQEIDLEKRDAMIAEAWEIAKASNVYLPLHHQVISWAMSDKLSLPIRADDSPRFYMARFAE